MQECGCQLDLSVLDFGRVSLALNIARNITSFASWPAASQPVEYLFKAVSVDHWLCRSAPSPLLVFFFFLPVSDGAEESVSVNETLRLFHSPLSLCHYTLYVCV